MENKDLKSLDAGKNAFRGYRHQTLYSINRIIGDHDLLNYKPEDKEDLSIYQDDELKEIVQVKSYSSPLNLSSLSPENEDSFLKRSINELKNSFNSKIKLVSFGQVGPELKNGFSENNRDRTKLKNKLVKNYNYSKEEVEMLFDRISVIEVNEKELMDNIQIYLEKSHVGTDPKMAFELLMYWIYEASEFGYTINKEILAEKLNTICILESEVKTYREEYGNSIVLLEPPEISSELKSNLEKEFSIGVSARYEHILTNLDVIRPEKLEKIIEEFEKTNVVIIRGASGQGKSTLAYRYLHESHPYPFVYNIKSKGRDAFKIVRAMKGISRSVGTITVFLDIEPGDTVWPEIVKELSRYPSFEVLVTIREEDWKRATLSQADLLYSEIELSLTKSEAQEIYNKIDDNNFVNFDDAWRKFGEKGPLLEFVYLIKQGDTLKDRLESQIFKIQKEANEEKEMGRLDILRIVSLNGKYGCKTDLPSLISEIELTNPGFFIDLFQKEYLIRLGENGRFLEGLHPIRSQILADILFDDSINPKESYVNDCLSTIVEEDLELFLLNCFVDFDINNEILGYLESYNPKKWSGYGNIIKSLLWLGIKKYVEDNWTVIDESYAYFQNAWSFAFESDLSNAMGGKAPNLFDLPNVDQEKKVKADYLRKRMTDKNQIYEFLEKWLENSDLPLENPTTEIGWQSSGFSLFWMGKLGIKKDIDISKFDFGKYVELISLESMGDMMIGLYYYDSSIINSIKEYKTKLEERYRAEYEVLLIEDDGENLHIHFVVDLLAFNGKNEENYLHSLAIRNISFIRKLYPDRKVISSKGYGHKFEIIDLDFDETIKKINMDKFPLSWLTKINSIFNNLVDYHYRPNIWGDYVENIISLRIESDRVLNKLLKNLKKYYKTRKNIDMLEMKNLNSDLLTLINDLAFRKTFPKVAVDQWGMTSENMDKDGIYNIPDLESSYSIGLSKFKQYIKFERDFFSNLNNFLKQSEHVIIKERIYKGNSPEEISKFNKFLEENHIEADFNHLSVLNLFNAFCNLVLFQAEFKKHFKKYTNSLDELETNEINLFKILSETWRMFAFESFKINKNILETAKTIFKMNESQLIRELLKNFIDGELDVRLVSKEKDGVKCDFFLINVSEPMETFQSGDKFIRIIKNTYCNIEYMDLERLILELRFNNFTGILLTKNKLLIQFSVNLPLSRAINNGSNTIPIDIMDIRPKKIDNNIIDLLEVDKWSEVIPEIGLMQKGIDSISELYHLSYHICQFKDIQELDDYGFKVVENYLKETSKLIQSDYKAVLDLLNFLVSEFKEEIKKDPEIANILKVIAETMKFPIEDDKKGFINLDSLKKWNSELKDVSQKMQILFLKFSGFIIDKHSN